MTLISQPGFLATTMSDMSSLAVALVTLAVAITGHAIMTWYRMGRMEGKLDRIMADINRHEENIRELYGFYHDKKGR